MQTIEDLRKQIDKIDQEIIKLLDRRYEIACNIGALKAQNDINVLDNGRENIIYSKIKGFDTAYKQQITAVYSQIMAGSKDLQKKLKK